MIDATSMNASEMQELLRGYLGELDWTDGVAKDDIMRHLAGRDDALRTMVNAYVPEGMCQKPDEIMDRIPAQAWQDVQGDRWQGAESQYVEDVPTQFQDGPVSQDSGDER